MQISIFLSDLSTLKGQHCQAILNGPFSAITHFIDFFYFNGQFYNEMYVRKWALPPDIHFLYLYVFATDSYETSYIYITRHGKLIYGVVLCLYEKEKKKPVILLEIVQIVHTECRAGFFNFFFYVVFTKNW